MGTKRDRKIEDFAQRVRKEYRIDRIILFGSRGRGDNRKRSDYDVVVVSKDFEGMGFSERASKMYLFWKFEEEIEPLCYTPEEFLKLSKGITIVGEAVREGVAI